MTVSEVTRDDLDWVVRTLGRRRQRLEHLAPVFWRRAPDAEAAHRSYVDHLLASGARGYRTGSSVLLAAPGDGGWLVDDLAVDADHYAGEGRQLWDAYARDQAGDHVRFVCPTYEIERAALATSAGLALVETWWLLELGGNGGGQPAQRVPLPGAEAVTVAAPPVYAPPGPILLLQAPTDAEAALPAALARAPEIGCAAVVVRQAADDTELARSLTGAGFRRHCDFFEGVVRPQAR